MRYDVENILYLWFSSTYEEEASSTEKLNCWNLSFSQIFKNNPCDNLLVIKHGVEFPYLSWKYLAWYQKVALAQKYPVPKNEMVIFQLFFSIFNYIDSVEDSDDS